MNREALLERDVLWQSWTGVGLEHLHLRVDADGAQADGLVIGTEEGQHVRLRYTILCDSAWRVRELHLFSLDTSNTEISLFADGEGHWIDATGQALANLEGCIDVDISATPFTNTLPIRRLGLEMGAFNELLVAYVAVPALEITPVRQFYSRLPSTGEEALYRYNQPAIDFTADLPVDKDGLVLDYPGLFRRVREQG